MNTATLRRLTSLALASLTVLPLCTLLVVGAARAEAPPGAPDAPASTAPAVQAAPAAEGVTENSDAHDRYERHVHHTLHGHHEQGDDLVNIGHDSNLPRGRHADSVVSIFGSSTSDGEAEDVVSILGDTRVTGEVSDSAVAVLGNIFVDGKIDGDAVAVLGNMQLGPHAEIGGNVVAIGGAVERDPAAIVHGSIQNVFAGNFSGVGWLRTWIHHCLLYGRPLALAPGLGWAWGVAFTFLALYAGLALLFREGLTRCVQTFESEPGHSILAALIAMLLTPVLVVLLCVTVIGIAAVPFVVVGLFCAGLFGKAVMLAWLGGRVTGKRGDGPMSQPAVSVLIGGALVLVLYLIPVLGFLVYKLLGILGLGAVVYTLILSVRAHRMARGGAPEPAMHGTAAVHARAPEAAAAAVPSAGPAEGPTEASGPVAASGPAPPAGPAPAAGPPPASAAAVRSPPVSPDLPRAGFWIRMVALLIDAILVGVLLSILHSHHLHLLVLAAYGAVMWKLRGSTIGGIVFDLRVVRLDGREVDWETAIVRALSCFLSLAVAGLGFIWIAFDRNNQAWHDKIAGTVVVRVAKGAPLV
jgi:uncharacterized RDD family membrane protein YckC